MTKANILNVFFSITTTRTLTYYWDEADIYRPTEVDAIEPHTCYYSNYTLQKGTAETISQTLQPYNNRAAHKPTTALRHLLTNVKDRDEPNNRLGAVNNIKCSDCQASDIGRDWQKP